MFPREAVVLSGVCSDVRIDVAEEVSVTPPFTSLTVSV